MNELKLNSNELSLNVVSLQEECNTHACDWDGKDCSSQIDPWENCTATDCWQVFGDGYCDRQCNNVGCLFDGLDCDDSPQQECA